MIASRVRAGFAVSAAAALMVAVTGCASQNASAGNGGLSGSSTPSTTPSTTATGAGPTQAAAGGPVPAGFSPRDLTFSSSRSGWLLGIAPCSSAPCTSIVHTTDGGKTWVGLPTPKADLARTGQNGCTSACIWGLRFADAHVGYAFGPTALYLTTTGGENWKQETGNADAIEIGNGTALRISHTTVGCPPGCTYQISSAAVGSTAWQPIAAPQALTGNEVRLLRTGHRAYLEVYQNPAGGSENAHATLLTSGDDGQHWAVHDDPCGTRSGQEADSDGIAVAEDGSLTVLCERRGGGIGFVVTSTDGGTGFGAQHLLPDSPADAVGAASATTLLVAVDGELFRSTNSGATWSLVGKAPGPSPSGAGSGVIGFETGQVGRWVPGSDSVLTTTDAGATWTTYTFRH